MARDRVSTAGDIPEVLSSSLMADCWNDPAGLWVHREIVAGAQKKKYVFTKDQGVGGEPG